MANPGRPVTYTDDSRVYISATGNSKLQSGSERRAIVNTLVENGGSMTLKELDQSFGFVIREKVFALQRIGWVRIEVEKKE
jgi:predicted neuraminidase